MPLKTHRLKNSGSAAISACLMAGITSAEVRRPNILWIIAEDLSPLMGCDGDGVNQGKKPAIGKLAADGVLFKGAFANAPV